MQPAILTEILQAGRHLTTKGITFIEGSTREEFLSYSNLYRSAALVLAFLQQKGMRPKDELLFQVEDNKTFIIVFWACVLGGIIPVPLSVGHNYDHKQKVFNVWAVLTNPYLIIFQHNLENLHAFAVEQGLEELYEAMSGKVIEEDRIMSCGEEGEIFNARESDIALVQFSSGSTGNPKGVMLTHRNLIRNLEAISKASKYMETDSMLSWMPLTHDMGLIGFHLNPVFCGMQHYLIPTQAFVRNPGLWLRKAAEYKVTVLCSPNFGYRYVLRHADHTAGSDADLSHVRIIYNGAEPVSDTLCREFLHAYAPYGLKPSSICPVYGLAEASLAVSISGLDDEVTTVMLDRHKAGISDRVPPAGAIAKPVAFVNVGRPVDYCQLRIAGEKDLPLGDGIIGHVQIKGENVSAGYYNNQEETKNAFTNDGWLKTGDVGFIKDGSLYITGRLKDLIFVNGRNYYPHDVERIAEKIEGVELNKIAVAGYFNEALQKEETIAFVFHRGMIKKFVPVARVLKALINREMGLEIDHIIPVKNIPRTTSGKLQRFKLLEQYRRGSLKEVEARIEQLLSEDSSGKPPAKPGNETEALLTEIWKQVLETAYIGAGARFFEAGGNSLKAAALASAISKEFEVDIPFSVLYANQTVAALAEVIASANRNQYTPISRISPEKYYPVTSAQKRLYYFTEVNKHSVAYNIPVAFRICGTLDIDKLTDCIRQLTDRHDTLRMSFHMMAEPVFRVHQHVEFTARYTWCAPGQENDTLKSLVQPFDLAMAPLFRIHLLRLSEKENILFADFHHIISDGISISNFMREMLHLYDGKELPLLPVRFRDVSYWEREMLAAEKIRAQEEYWLGRLRGELPLLELPTDYPRPVTLSTEGQKMEYGLSKVTAERLRKLAAVHDCTMHMLLFTIYRILLYKYSGQEDVIIGIPVAGRRHPDLQLLQGMFVNNLPLRSIIEGDPLFTELLQQEKANMASAFDNQDFPFGQLIRLSNAQREISRNPLFDTMFLYQNMELPVSPQTDFTVSRHFFDPGFSKFDLSLEIFDSGDVVRYAIEFSTNLFREETIRQFALHFENLLNNIADKPYSRLSELQVITSGEYFEYVTGFNATPAQFPPATIHQLFEEQVNKTPDHIAVEYGNKTFTYAQINGMAGRLALLLQRRGMEPENIVGILAGRSPGLIVSILAVLKAGGCFLPIDAGMPRERINYLLADSKCRHVLASAEVTRQASLPPDVDIIDIDGMNTESGEMTVAAGHCQPECPAYVIYTSGTSGKPKGVVIRHYSLVNYITWAAATYIKNETAAFPLYTSISFDLTLTSVFTPLITGNKIVVYDEQATEVLIEKVISDKKTNIIKLTPSHLKLLAKSKPCHSGITHTVKRFIVGGEKFETDLAEEIYRLFGAAVEIYNEYGPTEATIGCMIHRFESGTAHPSVPIGIPAANTQIYLLDKFLRPVPAGIPGELFISGTGLAAEYLFKEELTRQKFIPHPFLEGQKMYRTGDIARRLPGGAIEYIGRLDRQVKINGYRIELSEIENQLTSHELITEALVNVRTTHKKQQHIYAWYRSAKPLEAAAIRNYLAARLPYYMIPVQFIPIDQVILTHNGKVDYDALPEAETATRGNGQELPKNGLEEISVKIWEDMLGVENITVRDNFFELGGDSIKAVRITSRLYDQGIMLTAKDILTYQSIDQISVHAKRIAPENRYAQGIAAGQWLPAPVHAWFLEQQFQRPGHFNQSVLLRLNRKTDIRLFEKAFGILVAHHDGLRTGYDPEKNRFFYNNSFLNHEIAIETHEISNGEDAGTAVAAIGERLKSGFDITATLLIKAAVFALPENEELLFITAHHLVTDGITWRIILEDLYSIYTALEKGSPVELPAKTAALTDWQNIITSYVETAASGGELAYWKQVAAAPFAIPLDLDTTEWTMRQSARLSGSLSRVNTAFLVKEAHLVYKTDVLILLNVALARTLKEWTGQSVFIVEEESHGRHMPNIDISRTAGWFTAIYPVKLALKEQSVGNQIREIKELIRKIPNYGLGYGIYKYSGKSADSHKPCPAEIRFNYLGQFDRELHNDLFEYTNMFSGPDVAPANKMTARIECVVMIIAGELVMDVIYNKQAHKKTTIAWFINSFFNNLNTVLDHIRKEDGVHFTPSDFAAANLDQEELDALF